jgi:hypothetical protein
MILAISYQNFITQHPMVIQQIRQFSTWILEDQDLNGVNFNNEDFATSFLKTGGISTTGVGGEKTMSLE